MLQLTIKCNWAAKSGRVEYFWQLLFSKNNETKKGSNGINTRTLSLNKTCKFNPSSVSCKINVKNQKTKTIVKD